MVCMFGFNLAVLIYLQSCLYIIDFFQVNQDHLVKSLVQVRDI